MTEVIVAHVEHQRKGSNLIWDQRTRTTEPATEFATVQQLGAIVAARRRELDITQADSAQRCGVSRQWLVRFERGTNSVETGLALRTLRAIRLHLELATLSRPHSQSQIDP